VKKERHTAAITALLGGMQDVPKRAVERIRTFHLSSILTCTPSTVNGTALGPDVFRDFLALRYAMQPAGLPHRCEGCGKAPFNLAHAMNCANGGLTIRRHNYLRDVFGDLAKLAWGNALKEPIVEAPLPGRDGLRADLRVVGVWAEMIAALFDIRVTYTDAASYLTRTPTAVLESQAQEKIRKYGPSCARSHQHFTPLVLGVTGETHADTQKFMDAIARQLAGKWGKRLSDVKGWVHLKVQVALARASSLCIRGSREKWIGVGAADGAAIPQQD
jgi:hypothetical protein